MKIKENERCPEGKIATYKNPGSKQEFINFHLIILQIMKINKEFLDPGLLSSIKNESFLSNRPSIIKKEKKLLMDGKKTHF